MFSAPTCWPEAAESVVLRCRKNISPAAIVNAITAATPPATQRRGDARPASPSPGVEAMARERRPGCGSPAPSAWRILTRAAASSSSEAIGCKPPLLRRRRFPDMAYWLKFTRSDRPPKFRSSQCCAEMARRVRGIPRAARFARRMRILAAVIREPGLRPGQLAARAGVSESTLFRDLGMLRRQGYPVTFSDGYQLQESLGLDGPNPAVSLGAVYEHQLDLLKDQLPSTLADQVQAELEAEAPAALAAIVAAVIERQLQRRLQHTSGPKRGRDARRAPVAAAHGS